MKTNAFAFAFLPLLAAELACGAASHKSAQVPLSATSAFPVVEREKPVADATRKPLETTQNGPRTASSDPWSEELPTVASPVEFAPVCRTHEDCPVLTACGGYSCINRHCQPRLDVLRCVVQQEGSLEEGICLAGECVLEKERPGRCGAAAPRIAMGASKLEPPPTTCQTPQCERDRSFLANVPSYIIEEFVSCLGGTGYYPLVAPNWDPKSPFIMKIPAEPEAGGRPPDSGIRPVKH